MDDDLVFDCIAEIRDRLIETWDQGSPEQQKTMLVHLRQILGNLEQGTNARAE
jgi:hypothetical protein